jgi:hypothetical protein
LSAGNSDGTYGGIQPASYGLIHSRNTMSVRVGQFAGLDQVQKIATTLNLSETNPHGPAIYIGSFETNLKDLTTAYSAFQTPGFANKVISSSALMIRIISRFIEPLIFPPRAGSERGLDDFTVDGRSAGMAPRPVRVRWGSSFRPPAKPERLTIIRTRGSSDAPAR